MERYTVTVGQLVLSNPQAVFNQIAQALDENPETELFAFPEFATQHSVDLETIPYLREDAQARETAQNWLDLMPRFSEVQTLCDERAKAVLVGCLAQDHAQLFSRAIFYDPQQGQLAWYDKSHVHWTEGFLRPGTTMRPVKTRFGTLGILICYDAAFAEATRVHGVQGAEVLFVLSAIPMQFHWRVPHHRMIGAAVFNQTYVVAANLGHSLGAPMGGHSGIYGPQGDAIAHIEGTDSGTISARIDLARVRQWRKEEMVNPYRRPHLYRALTASVPGEATQ